MIHIDTMPKSSGSVALSRLGKTQAELADDLNVSRGVVGHWLSGLRTPRDGAARSAIERKYGIPSRLWDEAAKPTAAPVREHPAPVGTVDHLDIVGGAKAQLERLAQERAEADDPKLVARIEEIERATRHSLSLYLGEGRIISEAVILRSPAFTRIFDKIRKALRNHPQALLDVAEALESSGD